MLEYMLMPFRRYAEFTGRSRRMEFWAFALLNVIVYAIITAIILATTGSVAAFGDVESAGYSAMMSLFFGGAGLLYVIWWLATIIPGLAVTVRRLHDRDMSGWWYLGFIIASFVPLVGLVASIAFFVIMLLPGTPGPNRYGPDPKDPASVQVFA
ncbi:DUF805 domain-containing protein [Novosphingobium sp. M1R2S20]|uniref:DUF805 domain-containing protein n=1 Tax=Novosphingobium rhizovicinum TaxID=3228928 RepID=A0ABV3RFF1_9SPHN